MSAQPSILLAPGSAPWSRWILLSALLLLLSLPFLLFLSLPLSGNKGWRNYQPPSAVTSVRLPTDWAAKVSIDGRGTVRFSSGMEMSIPVIDDMELERRVSGALSKHPDSPVVLMIDQDTPYAKVAMVLSVLREAGSPGVFFHTVLP